MLKLLLAACLVVSSAQAVPETTLTPVDVDSAKPILQVACPAKGGRSMGTAFRIGRVIISANHVTDYSGCSIDGAPISSRHTPGLDFSITPSADGAFLKIDCAGYIEGHQYLAIGYARGMPFLTGVALRGTGQKSGLFSLLSGIFTVVPGMSGGPIIDVDTGKVVGIVNIYDAANGISGSVALKDTPVCKA
jgi:hypothetical protein